VEERLLSVADLAAEWGVTERRVREIVIGEGVPRIELGARRKNIRWGEVRFRREALAAWARDREVVAAAARCAKVEAKKPVSTLRPQAYHPLLGLHAGSGASATSPRK